jgi:hypothetical protein
MPGRCASLAPKAIFTDLEGVKYFQLGAKDLRSPSVSCRRMSGNGMEIVLQTANCSGLGKDRAMPMWLLLVANGGNTNVPGRIMDHGSRAFMRALAGIRKQ